LAAKPRFRLNPNRVPDDTSGFTVTKDQDLTLAEAVLLSIPPGSTMTPSDLLSNFPLTFVSGQASANAQSGGTA
jgi:hypothetical protein